MAAAPAPWSLIWIAVMALGWTAVAFASSRRWAWRGKPIDVIWRLVGSNVMATAAITTFARLDHTHPPSPPQAYVLALVTSATFIIAAPIAVILRRRLTQST